MPKMYETKEKKPIGILAMAVLTKEDNVEEDLSELKNLAEADNIEIKGEIWQSRINPDPKTMLGEGKIEELKQLIQTENADIVIFDNVLSGRLIVNLERVLNVKVIDRANLILDIFSSRALSNEGKLQVEVAQLKYALPRIQASLVPNSRSDRSGLRGMSESKAEINKRIIEEKIILKERELKKLKQERDLRRSKRSKSSKKLVALVGYTNSGKSTLLNLLTRSNVMAKDMLFATLDTTTRNLWLDNEHEIMLVDTVGFVNKLPHELIEAFSSTLEETTYADLLINVVDISNSHYQRQQEVVLNVLHQLGIVNTPIITAYNKADKINFVEPENIENEVYISAKTGKNIEKLKQLIKEKLFN